MFIQVGNGTILLLLKFVSFRCSPFYESGILLCMILISILQYLLSASQRLVAILHNVMVMLCILIELWHL